MTDKPSGVYLSGFLTQLQSSHPGPRLDSSALQQGGTVMAVPLGLQDFRLGPAIVAHPQLLPFGSMPPHPILPLSHQMPVADPETLRAQAQLLQLLQQRPILPSGAPAATQLTMPLFHPHNASEDRRSRFSAPPPPPPRSRRGSSDFVPTRPSPAGTEEGESGGRLAISFLLNDSNPTDHAHTNPARQKRKAEHQRSLEAPQRHPLSPEGTINLSSPDMT